MSLKEFLKPTWITIVSFIVLMILFAIIPVVPCKTFLVVPNYTPEWGVCLLNPMPTYQMVGVGRNYFGLEFDYFNIMIIASIIISYFLANLVNSHFRKK